jgi:hypothetical protein
VSDEIRDDLPADLDVSGFVGPYQFPDNSRRRIPAIIYAVVGLALIVVWVSTGGSTDAGTVNDGLGVAGVALVALAAYSFVAGRRMSVRERDALVHASREVGFAVGHASAQQVWRGFSSRPTWRVLCYSAEEPPLKRALVLIDAVDGHVVQSLVEDNPEGVEGRG